MKERIAYMDRAGIWAQIAYPNLLGFGGQDAMRLDAEVRNVSTQIFNDAMAELQAESDERIFPMATVPWWDLPLAIKEVERCADLGFRGINMTSDPHLHNLPDLGNPYWNPLWELCSDRSLPVSFHIGASDVSMSWYGAGAWPGHSETMQLAYGSLMVFSANMRVIANILFSRFLEKFPKLKIVSVESGAGWIPFIIEGVEYELKEAGLDYEIPPFEIFRRQIYACTWFERRNIVDTIRQVGVDNVMFETDFPHPTCLYPDALDYMQGPMLAMSAEERRKFFGGNALSLYRIEGPPK